MKLSVIIPCYNEYNTIQQIIDAVCASPYPDKEIIVVDDCSTDGTREILKGPLSGLIQQIFFHDVNQGKGAAIRTGVRAATGDVIIIQDADLEYDPNEYSLLIEPILNNKADVVYGSRFIKGSSRKTMSFWQRAGNLFLTSLSNLLANMNLTDMETCYKLFRRDIIQGITIEENRFGFEPEITAKIAKTRCRICEVEISYHGRKYSEGKKIGWKDGVKAIYCIVKYNLFQ